MIASPSLQREVKLGFLREACRALPGADEVEVQWFESPEKLGYRRRARLAWHRDIIGYRQLRSKRVTSVDECIVLMEPLRHAWNEVVACLASLLRGDGEIQLQLAGDERVVAMLVSDDEQDPVLYEACETLCARPVIAGVALRIGAAAQPAVWGSTRIALEVADGILEAPGGGFSQANDAVNARLVQEVARLASVHGAKVLELHAGVGNFTVALASDAKTLVAVEQDPRAVQACQRNLQARGLGARVVAGDANHPPKGRYDVVVLDPPRQGAKGFFESSSVLPGPARIVYVSCDTATLARDLRLAANLGYRLDYAAGFDMFPQTAHLESLVRLVRA
jgi:23S rRNA (uracil1939-C5)-methyltransferase